MQREMEDFTVADVYEHAAKIGQDIEQMIRDYGSQSVEQIMPKIVFTLEQLEGLAEKVQKDMAIIHDLNAEKEGLVIESKKESALRRQTEEKVDYLEALLNKDTKDLQNTISKLTEENELLKSEVEQLDEEMVHRETRALPGDIDLMLKMKTTIDSQRDQVRLLTTQEERHKTEIEALNEQTNRLTEMNERLRLYNIKLQDRLTKTVEHKVQAEATLASVQIVNEEKRDKDSSDSPASTPSNQTDVVDNGSLESQPCDGATKEFQNSESHIKSDSQLNSENDGDAKENKDVIKGESNMTQADVKNEQGKKQEPAKKDPNRPRYTLAEMQQVLEERNRYKEKVSMLEDVLEAYLPSTIKSSKLEAQDEASRKRKESKTKTATKKESKVRGIFGSFWKESSKDQSSKSKGD